VGEIRDKKGVYRNFVGDTITAMQKAGAKYYCDLVYLTPIFTARLRATRCFNASRKVCNVHQRVLVFVRGNVKEIVKGLTECECEPEEEASNDE
jgi:hypothetical protein